MVETTHLTANHWGTYRARVRDGKLVGMDHFEEDPDPSPIGDGIVDAINAPSRITAPAVRESWLEHGPGSNPHLRGKERFVEVTWETVEELVAKEITRIRFAGDLCRVIRLGERGKVSSRSKPVKALPELYGWLHKIGFHLLFCRR